MSPSGPAERQDDPPANRLGDAAGAFADGAANGVGLLEVRVCRIEDQRLAPAQLVIERAPKARAPALRHARGDCGGLTLFLVEVDVEVVGAQHLEREGAVLDLVAAEVLLRGGLVRHEREERGSGTTDVKPGEPTRGACRKPSPSPASAVNGSAVPAPLSWSMSEAARAGAASHHGKRTHGT